MKSRDSLMRLKKFQVDEKRRKVSQIEAMIAEFEDGPSPTAWRTYALGLAHKHVPEIEKHGSLAKRPIFVPSVGRFAQGMIVSLPLHLWALPGSTKAADVHAALADHYAGRDGAKGVKVSSLKDAAAYKDKLDAEDLNEMIAELKGLTPRPGAGFGGEPAQTVVPDVHVRPDPAGGWRVELNADTLFRFVDAFLPATAPSAVPGRGGAGALTCGECTRPPPDRRVDWRTVPEFQTSPGMRDILPPESARWRRFVEVFAGVVESAGYGQIVPPLLEDLGVFQRIGDATDVVSKEMYDFVDKGGRHIALRPELTASVCRAYVQHRPLPPWKVWSS